MTARLTILALFVSLVIGSRGAVLGQQYYPQQQGQRYPQNGTRQQPARQPTQQPAQRAAQPQGPQRSAPGQAVPPGARAIVPQNQPELRRRAPQMAAIPFQITPAQQAQVDALLTKWEAASKDQERITINFYRLDYNPTFTDGKMVPMRAVLGEADITSAGKWMFSIFGEIEDQKLIKGQGAEKLVCDGKSIYEFNYPGKTVTRHVLGPDMKGSDMVKAMLPFLFGTSAQDLHKRYFIRLIEFPGLPEGCACIDAWPRYLEERKNFTNARMIVELETMKPKGLSLTLPDGKSSHRYNFTEVKINPNNLLERLNDPFKVKVPSGWATDVQQLPESQPQMGSRPEAGPIR